MPLFFHFQLRVRNSQLNPNWHLDMGYQFFGVPGFLIGSGSGINVNVVSASATGWSGIASPVSRPSFVCSIYVSEDSTAVGEPICTTR
jgi:hypothetical protein